jgi:hypothetical protein
MQQTTATLVEEKRKLYCVSQQNLDFQYRLRLKGIFGLLTNGLPAPALALSTIAAFQVAPTTASVLEVPPIHYIEYDDMSSLAFPRSNKKTQQQGRRWTKKMNSKSFDSKVLPLTY